MTRPFDPAKIPSWPPTIDAVRSVLDQAWQEGSWGLYEGAFTEKLAEKLCQLHQTAYAYPCASGTIAVELALRGLDVRSGDEVILAGYDFPGNFRAIEAIGARPVLVDVVPQGWVLDPNQLEAAYSPQVKAVIASHMHGMPAPAAEISQWCRDHRIPFVEDACQMPGALIQGKPSGNWGDCGILSFGGSKLLTAGRGGTVVTSREDVLQRIKLFAERGNQAFPLSQLQAAVLLPQLEKLQHDNLLRWQAAKRLRALLQQHPRISFPEVFSADQPSFYKLGFQWQGPPSAGCGLSARDEVVCQLREKGLPLDSGFRGFGKRGGRRCRVASSMEHSLAAAEQTILIHHPILLADDAILEEFAEAVLSIIARH